MEVHQQLSGDVSVSSSTDVEQHAKVALAGRVEGSEKVEDEADGKADGKVDACVESGWFDTCV